MTVTDLAPPDGGLELGGDAAVSFEHGSGPALSDIVVEWDFDNDGDFDEAEEDVTGYLVSAETLAGRDWPSHLTGKAGPGHLRLTLRNEDDRFSYFQAGSPLNADPFSLRTGRRIRVRTAESTPDDPVLLVRDRFNRSDGALGGAETGQAWQSPTTGTFAVAGELAQASAHFAQAIHNVVDCGEADHYVQATLRKVTNDRRFGLIVRYTDANNHAYVTMSGAADEADGLSVWEVDGGVTTELTTVAFRGWEGMTLGVGVVGSTITAYINGVEMLSDTLADNPSGTSVGLYADYDEFEGTGPQLDDFYCWDHVAGEQEGVLWTGTITQVAPSVDLGPIKVATVAAEGVLAQAAGTDIQAPRIPVSGATTGLLAGDAMARAGLCHPPAPGGFDAGDVTLGPVGVNDTTALTVARQAEETERGFLHESNEGYPAFQSASARASATPQAWFSDTAGVGQFGYGTITPLDHGREIVNRVTAGVAPTEPSGFSITDDFGAGHVDVTLPATAAHDLVTIFIASSIQDGHDWNNPIWWTAHRDLKAALGMRIYSHHCDGTESGDTIRFYTNSGPAAGNWAAQIWKIPGWYLASAGLAMAEVANGPDPNPLVHGWGRVSTLYIGVRTGIGGTGGGMVWAGDFDIPDGYIRLNNGFIAGSGTPALDVGIMNAYKIDCTESEDPTSFGGLDNVVIDESVLFAIRGYNGEHEILPTIKNPNQFGPSPGRFVTVDDDGSQDEHNLIRSHRNAPNLFATEADAQAYGEGVLATYSDDRPIVTLSFWASKNEAYRQQAIRRRVGHKITLTASGTTGLGIDGEFFIESIGHKWTKGSTLWEVTWELSPA